MSDSPRRPSVLPRLLLVGLLIGTMWYFASRADKQERESGGKADSMGIARMLEAQDAAWNKGDLDGFMEAYWDSDELTFFAADKIEKGRKALKERYEKKYRADGKEMGKLTFSDLDIRLHGKEHALARGRWKLELKGDSPHGLFTLSLRKIDGQWRIIHDHTSAAEKK